MAKMWVCGEDRAAISGESFAVINPATEEVVDTVPRAQAVDVHVAVDAAARAFDGWRFVPGLEKAQLMHASARWMRDYQERLATLLTREGGKPLCENRDEVEWVAAVFDYYAEVGRDSIGRVIAPTQLDQFNCVLKEPYGVVACIVPWNYPLLLLAWKMAPALAAGNTLVIKPSEYTPLSTLMLMEAFRDYPDGVVNVVTGYGAEAGEPLVTDDRVRCVAFTGSVATGRRIATLAAQGLKKTTLEMGGNDPFIICDDVDVDIAVRGAAWAAFLNMGQVCTSAERFYVFRSIHGVFMEKLVAHTRSLRLGDPLQPGVDLGPMVSDNQRQKVERKISEAEAMGARTLTGGSRPAKFPKGYYLEPAVLDRVDHRMELMREETFGPVAPVMAVDGIDEAIRLANDSRYGLGANIYTNNLEYTMRAVHGIKAGTFWINDPLTDNDAGPFGGMRMSGIGRELGIEGLEEFRETKHVHMDYRIGPKPYWFPYK
ncbi:MAG: aldehyde dehydrogenase [Acidobacteria bacterium]|nr:aldehyde dehydrogenase [Acidobacteriota bacterium]